MNIEGNRWIEYDPPEWNNSDEAKAENVRNWRMTKLWIAIIILLIVIL